jgi:hypothetical protein
MIEFIQPVFNQFTLELPPFVYRVPYSGLEYEAACNARTMAVSDLRKAKRCAARLEAVGDGGWVLTAGPFWRPNDIPESTRPARRRAQLGRA